MPIRVAQGSVLPFEDFQQRELIGDVYGPGQEHIEQIGQPSASANAIEDPSEELEAEIRAHFAPHPADPMVPLEAYDSRRGAMPLVILMLTTQCIGDIASDALAVAFSGIVEIGKC